MSRNAVKRIVLFLYDPIEDDHPFAVGAREGAKDYLRGVQVASPQWNANVCLFEDSSAETAQWVKAYAEGYRAMRDRA